MRSILCSVLAAALLMPLVPPGASMANEKVEKNLAPSTDIPTLPLRVEALCSLYSKYEVCHPTIKATQISANFPTDFIQLNVEDIVAINIYDARRTEFNYILGSASTLIFGPYGLLGLLAMRRIGDVDFGFTYMEDGKKRTAFIRFKNNNSVEKFANAIKPFLKAVDAFQAQAKSAKQL